MCEEAASISLVGIAIVKWGPPLVTGVGAGAGGMRRGGRVACS